MIILRATQMKWIALVVGMVVLSGCPSEKKDAFTLYENGTNPVASFYGFVDNLEQCQRAASIYNAESSSDPEAWAAVGRRPNIWTCARDQK